LPPLPDLERDVEDFDDSENYKSNNKDDDSMQNGASTLTKTIDQKVI
jgi:hypothetical protein